MKKLYLLFVLSFFTSPIFAQQIRAYLDLQIHPTIHVPYTFFGEGLRTFEEGKEPKLSYNHRFKDVNFANYLKDNAGVRILCHGAIFKEWMTSKKKAKKMLLKQIQFINDYAANHPDDFAIAKSPQEVRDLVLNTDKTIFIHSIEGGKAVINSAEDAQFWADQGVSFVTLIHLMDDKNGAAGIQPGLPTAIINFKGLLRREKKRRLTEHGEKAILWLANAGIMTDITHMSDLTRKDALAVMEAHHIPPLSTHDSFKPIQNHPLGIDEADLLSIYRNNGLFSLAICQDTHNPYPEIQAAIDSMDCFCDGSIDTYKLSYQVVQKFIEGSVPVLSGDPSKSFNQLSEEEKVQYAIGFETDFNGWANHERPRYGKNGCSELVAEKEYEVIETDGMLHPGYLESHWNLLKKEGVDLAPIERSAEKFLQMWEYMLENKGGF